MARGDTPLFDAVSRKRGKKNPFELPDWAQPKTEQPVEKVSAGVYTVNKSHDSVNTKAWLMNTVVIRMPRLGMGFLAVVGLLLVIGAYILGYEMAMNQNLHSPENATLQALRNQEVNQQLLPEAVPRVVRQPAYVVPVGDTSTTAQPVMNPAAYRDPRESGLNYYRLMSVIPQKKDEAYRIIEFLQQNKVDATLIPLHNGSFKIVALKGFKKPYSDPEAEKYLKRLKELSRLWKARQNGYSTWSEPYPEKYVKN